MQRADAEIGRAGLACLFAGDRERSKVTDPLIATALVRSAQGIELGRRAKALTCSRCGAVGLRRRYGQRAFDAVDDETMPADWQRWQRNCALGNGATVGKVARGAIGGLNRPFCNRAVFTLDPRFAGARHVAQRGDEW